MILAGFLPALSDDPFVTYDIYYVFISLDALSKVGIYFGFVDLGADRIMVLSLAELIEQDYLFVGQFSVCSLIFGIYCKLLFKYYPRIP